MMRDTPNLIVMLTQHDRTVPDACEIFEQCRGARAQYWGMKELGLPFGQMRQLFARMKRCGKKTALEVVAYSEPACLRGAEMAADCGCDLLMGTLFFDSVSALCRRSGMRYLPFVGRVSGRPSVLSGSAGEMLREAERCLAGGAFGVDLLSYRYTGDGADLMKRLTSQSRAPVCVAGSVNSLRRLDEIRAAAPWGFTVGSAFFEHRFGEALAEQIERVCARLEAS